MRNLLRAVKMVKGLHESTFPCVQSAAYSKNASSAGYREAVKALNLLQTNASVLQEVRKKRRQGFAEKNDNVSDTYRFLTRSGVNLEELDALPVIHVAGTKGKGSTCAFCESILRHWGMGNMKQTWKDKGALADGIQPIRTGLYTSPHLVEVRERIQLNGKPISQEMFAVHFWSVYDVLMEKREHEGDMPPYFKFLTVLAFNVFLKEGVDVAVIEVGIGGQHDCTNIIRKPIAVGITSLGIDHTSILGDTVEKIAWQKAGILKEGAPAFTVIGQAPSALAVLEERAKEKGVSLKLCPPFSSYFLDHNGLPLKLRVSSKVQEINVSLALQLANTWIKWHQHSTENGSDTIHPELCMTSPFKVDSLMAAGLQECKWPGRAQILHLQCSSSLDITLSRELLDDDMSITFFLDGAHTRESIQLCLDWFENATYKEESRKNAENGFKECNGGIDNNSHETVRILLFNSTGDRDVEELLSPFAKSTIFHSALFSPNSPNSTINPHSDQTNFTVSQDQQNARCEEHLKVWLKYNPCVQAQIYSCVADALASLKKLSSSPSLTKNKHRNVHVLVSGSLHLVGSVLSIVDPNLSSSYPENEPDDADGENLSSKSSERLHSSASSYLHSSPTFVQCNGLR